MHNEHRQAAADVPSPTTAMSSVEISSDLQDVWQAITGAGLEAWMGEGAEMGASVGDDLVLPDPATGIVRRGLVQAVRENECLEYTWWPEGDRTRETRVAIELEPCEAGTLVTVTESLPPAVTLSPSLSMPSPQAACAVASGAWAWRVALLVVATTSALTLAR